jgi:hypothetical protein
MAETTAEVTQDLDVPTAGNVANSRAWHLAHVPWELRLQLEELQQHGEAQPRRTCLVAHQSGQVFRLPVPPHRHPCQLGDLCMEQVRPYRPGHPCCRRFPKITQSYFGAGAQPRAHRAWIGEAAAGSADAGHIEGNTVTLLLRYSCDLRFSLTVEGCEAGDRALEAGL